MKKLLMLVFLPLFLFCQPPKQAQVLVVQIDSTAYYKAKCDTLSYMVSAYETAVVNYENNETGLSEVIASLNDSILKLNAKPLMTKAQFIELYKYERLLKYYKICKNKPTQWKYYKGWSIRVFDN
ncbi:MAG TPA: hypothetical protein VIK55_19330 [Paludibacter sp.]